MTLRVHCIQHVPGNGPGNISNWAASRGHRLVARRPDDGLGTIELDEVDFLIVMGGLPSAWEEDLYPWLRSEKELMRQCLSAGKPLLGICLGAQMLADVIGGRVVRNTHAEIGWWEIHRHASARRSSVLSLLPERFTPMSWHQDVVELPPGIGSLAGSAVSPNQAFEGGPRAWGLQCHMEYTPQDLKTMVSQHLQSTPDGAFVQTGEQILAGQESIRTIEPLFHRLLDAMGQLCQT